MQPSSREMQGLNSLMNPSSQMSSLHDLQQNGHHHHHHHQHQQQQPPQIPNSQLHQHHNHNQQVHQSFEQSSAPHDDFLEQMLSTLPSCSWPPDLSLQNPNKSTWDPNLPIKGRDSPPPPSSTDDLPPFHHFDESALLTAKLRQHQISGGNGNPPSKSAMAAMMLQQQMMMSRGVASANGMGRSPSSVGSGGGDSGLVPLPLSLNGGGGDLVERSQNDVVDASVQGLINGFTGSLNGSGQMSNQSQHFHHPQGGTMQAQNFGAQAAVMNGGAQANGSAGGGGGGAPAQPRQRVRARRGQATDPHSIAERLRRERIAERMKALQELVPNANKTDKASMLDEIIDYVKFLQLQVKVLSMSRLGGAAAVAPLVADMSSEGGGDCLQSNNGGGMGRGAQTASTNDSMTVTEHQVAKLMEEDMGSAMQYLQGKGLCLMPISLATAISTSTCHTRSHLTSTATAANQLLASNGGGEGGPSSPSVSVLTVQSATMGNNGDNGVKDAASVSKP